MNSDMLVLDEGEVSPRKKEVFQRMMSGAGEPVYVFGRNKYAQRVSRTVKVQAYVDDFTKERFYMDRPVIRLGDLPGKCIVVSCVMDTLPITALDRLRSAGVREVVDYFTLARLAPKVFAPVDFCAGNR